MKANSSRASEDQPISDSGFRLAQCFIEVPRLASNLIASPAANCACTRCSGMLSAKKKSN
jgi:hypothetical protein